MLREMAFAKIHRATVTQAELHYEGSITVDANLLELAGILPSERVQVLDVQSGSRFETYTIAGEPGSGVICVNGPAARLCQVGDTVVIISYGLMTDEEARAHSIRVVHVDARNHPLS
ncbi:MAG: hypothetical protein RL318_1099 [Fibrobacterota bacterium]|jgi:aspartate 1-decarboxylase